MAETEPDVESGSDEGHLRWRRIHPLGWVLIAWAVGGIVGRVMGTSYLIGRMRWWMWVANIIGIVMCVRYTWLHRLRIAIEAVSRLSRQIAWRLSWLVFFISLFNVITRYGNDYVSQDILIGEFSSLAWMVFGLTFLLGVNYGVMVGVNPRVDFWWTHFDEKRKAWLDFVLHITLLFPFTIMSIRILWGYAGISLGRKRSGVWPSGWKVWETWEQSTDAGGLPVGPIKAMILVGFILWASQVVAQVIKEGFILIDKRELAGLDEVPEIELRVE